MMKMLKKDIVWCKSRCKGPTTYNACGVMKWNEGTSYPIQSGHPVIGCSEEKLLGQWADCNIKESIFIFGRFWH